MEQNGTYGTKWEVYGLKLDGVTIPYNKTGTVGTRVAKILIDLNTVNISVDNSNYGSVSSTNLLAVQGSTFTTSGTTLNLSDGRKVTASVKNATGYTTKFTSWAPASGTINVATSITANFSRTINQYTVTYNANGGNGTMSTDTVTYKSPYTTKANEFTRKGYTFKGWNEKPDGTGVDWTSYIGKPWTWTYTKNVTLYAQWTANQYTVTYNANGGTGSMATETIAYNSAYTTKANAFLKTGYTFKGWNEKPDGTGTDWTNYIGKPWTWTYTKSITLYAQWTINSYKIDLNLAINGAPYYYGYDGRVYVGLRVDGKDKGYVEDYGGTYTYGTNWEIYGLKLDGVSVPYKKTGIVEEGKTSIYVNLNTVNIETNDSNYGTVSSTNLLAVQGSTFTTSGTTLSLSDGRKVTASVKNATGYTTKFTSWSIASGTINKATSIIANFSRTINQYTLTVNPNGGTWNNYM